MLRRSTESTACNEVRQQGFSILPTFIEFEQLLSIRRAALALTPTEHLKVYPKSSRVWDLHTHGDPFLQLLRNGSLDQILTDLLGQHYLLSDFSLNTIAPNQPGDTWHVDYPWNEMDRSVAGSLLGVQCILPLDQFTSLNGATELQPGSHLRQTPPEGSAAALRVFSGAPGSLLIMAAAVWHRSGVNNSGGERSALLLSFVERWVRPMMQAPSGHVTDDGRLRQLLGLTRRAESINGVPI
jgi:ectoine hydroxylase-related dioxygenase (phytanoyl-CoA dioxygenase family)